MAIRNRLLYWNQILVRILSLSFFFYFFISTDNIKLYIQDITQPLENVHKLTDTWTLQLHSTTALT